MCDCRIDKANLVIALIGAVSCFMILSYSCTDGWQVQCRADRDAYFKCAEMKLDDCERFLKQEMKG